jgi:acetyl esterase/lipase
VPFKAVAGVHPGLPEPDAHDWRNVNSTILLCTGSDDPIVTPDQVLTFSHALQDSGIDWRVTVYGGAKHAFWSRPTNPNGLPKSLVMFRRPCQVSATTRYMQSAIGEQFWISLKRVMAISSDRSTRTQTFVEWRAATVLCHNRTVVTPPVRVRLPRNGGASGRLASANPKPAGT